MSVSIGSNISPCYITHYILPTADYFSSSFSLSLSYLTFNHKQRCVFACVCLDTHTVHLLVTDVINHIGVWKCWCVSWNHLGEEQWRQPLSEEDNAGHARLLPGSGGNLGVHSMWQWVRQRQGETGILSDRGVWLGNHRCERICWDTNNTNTRFSQRRKPLWFIHVDCVTDCVPDATDT